MKNHAKGSRITEHISKDFINFALGAISSLDMNTPHGVRCIAKSLDHRDLWTVRSPKNPIGTNVPIAKPINPTPMGPKLTPIIEKKTDQRRAGNHR